MTDHVHPDVATSQAKRKVRSAARGESASKRPRLTVDTNVGVQVGDANNSASATSNSGVGSVSSAVGGAMSTPTTGTVGSPTISSSAVSTSAAQASVATRATTPGSRRQTMRHHCQFPGCGRHFDRKSRTEVHERTHYRGTKAVKCEFNGCDSAFYEVKHMKEHMAVVHKPVKNYTCAVQGCGLSFRSASHLKRHGKVHTNADAHRCVRFPPCAQSFRKEETLIRHVRADHLGLRPFVCTVDSDSIDDDGNAVGGCGETFTTREGLKAHEEKEHGGASFICAECQPQPGPRFNSQADLRAHWQQEHVRCEMCDVTFATPADVRAHAEIFHSENAKAKPEERFRCSECPKVFASRRSRRQHVRTAHQGVRWVCGEVDIVDQSSVEGFDSDRDGCGEEFTTKAAVLFHIRYVHLGQQRPAKPRPVFPAASVALGALSAWLAAPPEEETRPLTCHFIDCDARFARHHDLKLHVEEHSRFDHDLGDLGDSSEGDKVPSGCVPVEGAGAAFWGRRASVGCPFVVSSEEEKAEDDDDDNDDDDEKDNDDHESTPRTTRPR